MGFDMNNRIIRRLERLKKQGQGRVLRRVESLPGEGMKVILFDGEKACEAVNFCSNDYLGFASERRIHPTMEACISASAGSGSSRLIPNGRGVCSPSMRTSFVLCVNDLRPDRDSTITVFFGPTTVPTV